MANIREMCEVSKVAYNGLVEPFGKIHAEESTQELTAMNMFVVDDAGCRLESRIEHMLTPTVLLNADGLSNGLSRFCNDRTFLSTTTQVFRVVHKADIFLCRRPVARTNNSVIETPEAERLLFVTLPE
jgi:hypothetical protein